MTGATKKTPAKKSQDSGKSKVGYKRPPKERQFGQPNGNPPGHGFFKAEDTARAKLEKIITLTREELQEVLTDEAAPEFERTMAQILIDDTLKTSEKWKIVREMIDEIYGYPKQQVAAEVAEVKPLVDLRKRKKNGDHDGSGEDK